MGDDLDVISENSSKNWKWLLSVLLQVNCNQKNDIDYNNQTKASHSNKICSLFDAFWASKVRDSFIFIFIHFNTDWTKKRGIPWSTLDRKFITFFSDPTLTSFIMQTFIDFCRIRFQAPKAFVYIDLVTSQTICVFKAF